MDNENKKDFRTRELERRKPIQVNEDVDRNKGRTLGTLDSASSSTKADGKSSRVKDVLKRGKSRPIDKFQKTSPKSTSKPGTIMRGGGGGGGGRIKSQQKFMKGGKVLPRLDFDILSEKEDRQTVDEYKPEIAQEGNNSNNNQIELLGNNDDNGFTASEFEEIKNIDFEALNNDSTQNPAEELELASLDMNTDPYAEVFDQTSISPEIELEEPSISLEENDEIGSFYDETGNYDTEGPDMDMDGGDD